MKEKRKIKVIFCDVDGTLTDGRLYYSEKGENIKVFHVKDGQGIKHWENKGNRFCVISARSSNIINKRMEELGVTEIFMNSKNKVARISEWLEKNNLTWEETAYIGDDVNDLDPILKSAISGAPADAATEILQAVNYTCILPGGLGCVREFIDYLLDFN